jgi:hypothetical protein
MAKHIKSQFHLDKLKKRKNSVPAPGASAEMLLPGMSVDSVSQSSASPTQGMHLFFKIPYSKVILLATPSLKQLDLKQSLIKDSVAHSITDDFVAAMLHMGLPVTKLDHDSFRGLLQKYTRVEG